MLSKNKKVIIGIIIIIILILIFVPKESNFPNGDEIMSNVDNNMESLGYSISNLEENSTDITLTYGLNSNESNIVIIGFTNEYNISEIIDENLLMDNSSVTHYNGIEGAYDFNSSLNAHLFQYFIDEYNCSVTISAPADVDLTPFVINY